MIETHDQHKPGNLANSAVLKMLEEEESERVYPVNERKSRPRQRHPILDRDTVLKINRRPYYRRKRDFSWPPQPRLSSDDDNDRSRSRSSSVEIQFDDSTRICRRHEIFHLKEMFDRGAIDDNIENIFRGTSNKENIRIQQQSHDGNIINSENVKCNTRMKEKMNLYDWNECTQNHHEWPPKYTSSNNEPIIMNRTYYFPENELQHIGIVEPKRKYFERAASSSPDGRRNREDGIKSPVLKRWKSNENVETTIQKASPSLRNKNFSEFSCKQFNMREIGKATDNNRPFLERYKSNSYSELPPLKPRREYHKHVYSAKNKLNLNNSKGTAGDKANSQYDDTKRNDGNENVRTKCMNCNTRGISPALVCENCNIRQPLANTSLTYEQGKIDNYYYECESVENRLDTPAAKNLQFNLQDGNEIHLNKDHSTKFDGEATTANHDNRTANNCNYEYCCCCDKIAYEHKTAPQSSVAVVNYDLATDTKYDAKNIRSHNLSVKINENVNNISKNNCIYDCHHRHHHQQEQQEQHQNHSNHTVHKYEYDDNVLVVVGQNDKNNNSIMKNVLQDQQMIENDKNSPEITNNKEELKKNGVMGVMVTSVAYLPSTSVTTSSIAGKSTTTIIPSAIIMAGYRDGMNTTDLKGKSRARKISGVGKEGGGISVTSTSIDVCDEEARTYQSATVSDTAILKGNDDDGSQGNQKPKRDENLQTTFGKQENITSNIRRRQGEIFKDTKENEKKYGQEIMGLSMEDKKKWRRGIYFTDGEYMWGPYEEWPFEGEPPNVLKNRIEEIFRQHESDEEAGEIETNDKSQEGTHVFDKSTAEEKAEEISSEQRVTSVSQSLEQYSNNKIEESCSEEESENVLSNVKNLNTQKEHNQKSITQNLRQIDEYMETAEQALNDAERQLSEPSMVNNILVFDTPLQAVIKDIFKKRLSPLPSDKTPPLPPIRQTFNCSYFNPMVNVVENMPVVEHALLDLYHISMALDTLNNLTNTPATIDTNATTTATGSKLSSIPYLSDDGIGIAKARITELSAVHDDDNNDDNIGRDEVSLSTTTSPHSVCDESLGSTSGTEYQSSPSVTREVGYSTIKTTSTHTDKIIHSKNILSGFLITKQNQEEAFAKAGIELFEQPPVTDFNITNEYLPHLSKETFVKGNSFVIVDLPNGKTFQSSKEMTTSNDPLNIDKRPEETKSSDIISHLKDNKFSQNVTTHDGIVDRGDRGDGNVGISNDDDNIKSGSGSGSGGTYTAAKIVADGTVKTETNPKVTSWVRGNDNDNHSDDFDKQQVHEVHEVAKSKTDNQLHLAGGQTTGYAKLTYSHSYDDNNKSSDSTMNKDDKLIVEQRNEYDDALSYSVSYPDVQHADDNVDVRNDYISDINKEIKLTCDHFEEVRGFEKSFNPTGEELCRYPQSIFELNQNEQEGHHCYRSRQRQTSHNRNANNKNRSISQPPVRTLQSHQLKRIEEDQDDEDTEQHLHHPYLVRQHSFDSSESRYYASPSLYMCGNFEPTEGYRKVAWPPVSDSAPIKASTPQPQQPPHQNQYQPPSQHQYQQPYHPSGQQQQQQQSYQPQSQPQYNQPEQQYYHPQAQQPQYQPTDRGQSPGIITLRKEPPISQRPAPVVTSQPAAASFGGGSNMRGDLKWPPPDVKAQMAAENEERIKLAKSPPFRPRRIHKDYTQFFAKHALNNNYPGYKVPPGTQHVYAQF